MSINEKLGYKKKKESISDKREGGGEGGRGRGGKISK